MRALPSVVRSAWAALFWLSASAASTSAIAAEENLPRYKFEVGQELRFSGHDEFEYESGRFVTDSTWRVWVVRQNGNGSWRLILRSGSIEVRKMNAVLDAARRLVVGPQQQDEQGSFAWCDFSPSGAVVENDSFGYRMNPRTLLVSLPSDSAGVRADWSARDCRLDEVYRCRLAGDEGTESKIKIHVTRDSPMNEIYGFEFNDIVTFDRQRGIPEKIESRSKQTYGFKGQGQGVMQLDEMITHDADSTRGFAGDAERYFAAHESYNKALATKDQSGEELRKTLQTAAAELRAVKEEIKSPDFLKQIDHDLAQHERMVDYYLGRANNRAAVLNQPAADWTCQDMAGKEHVLKEYRGRVVVLDFWYRGCGWCIRSMPQMKEIAMHFADKPVTIFGMNTDRVEDDARFVIDKMGLNYGTLKAAGVPEKYKVQGFPTLLIIDQEGVLRDIHVGYSPDLKKSVVESIERLLNKKS